MRAALDGTTNPVRSLRRSRDSTLQGLKRGLLEFVSRDSCSTLAKVCRHCSASVLESECRELVAGEAIKGPSCSSKRLMIKLHTSAKERSGRLARDKGSIKRWIIKTLFRRVNRHHLCCVMFPSAQAVERSVEIIHPTIRSSTFPYERGRRRSSYSSQDANP